MWQIRISEKAIDPRKATWICIEFDNLPVFQSIIFKFQFPRKRKAKFWDLYLYSCCEDLNASIEVKVR